MPEDYCKICNRPSALALPTGVHCVCPEMSKRIWEYIQNSLKGNPFFTGKLEINFCDGKLMDINKTERTKF